MTDKPKTAKKAKRSRLSAEEWELVRCSLRAFIDREEEAALRFAIKNLIDEDGNHFERSYDDLVSYCNVNGLTIGSTARGRALDLLAKLAKRKA